MGGMRYMHSGIKVHLFSINPDKRQSSIVCTFCSPHRPKNRIPRKLPIELPIHYGIGFVDASSSSNNNAHYQSLGQCQKVNNPIKIGSNRIYRSMSSQQVIQGTDFNIIPWAIQQTTVLQSINQWNETEWLINRVDGHSSAELQFIIKLYRIKVLFKFDHRLSCPIWLPIIPGYYSQTQI